MTLKFTTSYLEDSLEILRYYKKLGERAMAQVTEEKLFATLDAEANSIAIVVKHMAGNMRSRHVLRLRWQWNWPPRRGEEGLLLCDLRHGPLAELLVVAENLQGMFKIGRGEFQGHG